MKLFICFGSHDLPEKEKKTFLGRFRTTRVFLEYCILLRKGLNGYLKQALITGSPSTIGIMKISLIRTSQW